MGVAQPGLLYSALAAWVPGMLICDLRLKSHCQGLPRNHDLGCSSRNQSSSLQLGERVRLGALETEETAACEDASQPFSVSSDDLSDKVQSLADW